MPKRPWRVEYKSVDGKWRVLKTYAKHEKALETLAKLQAGAAGLDAYRVEKHVEFDART